MATSSGNVVDESFPAGASLVNDQYKVVKINSTGQAVLAAAATAGHGILQNDPASGEMALVRLFGVSKAVAAASVTLGSLVASNTTSQVATTTTANNKVLGWAIEGSSGAGEIIRVFLTGLSNY